MTKRMKRKPGKKRSVLKNSPSSSRGRAVNKKGRRKTSAKIGSTKKSTRPFFPSQIGRFDYLKLTEQGRKKKIIPEKKLQKAYGTVQIPCWAIDYEIALRKTTFLLSYKDGNKIELNIRLQFHHTTWTHNANVYDRRKLFQELVTVIRDSKADVDHELIYKDDSVLFYDCTSYSYGAGTMPQLIEVIYIS